MVEAVPVAQVDATLVAGQEEEQQNEARSHPGSGLFLVTALVVLLAGLVIAYAGEAKAPELGKAFRVAFVGHGEPTEPVFRMVFMGYGEPTLQEACAAIEWTEKNIPKPMVTHIYTDAGGSSPADMRQYEKCDSVDATYHSVSTNLGMYHDIVIILDSSDMSRETRNPLTSKVHDTLLKAYEAKKIGIKKIGIETGRLSIVFKAHHQRALCHQMESVLRENKCTKHHDDDADFGFADAHCASNVNALKQTLQQYAAAVGRSKGAPPDALYYAMFNSNKTGQDSVLLDGVTALNSQQIANDAAGILGHAGSTYMAAKLQPVEHKKFASKVEAGMKRLPVEDFEDEFVLWKKEQARWIPRIPYISSMDERTQKIFDLGEERRNDIGQLCPHYNVGIIGTHGVGKSTTVRWISMYAGAPSNYLKQMSVAQQGGKTHTLALTKYKIGDSAVRLWDTKGIRPEWLKGNATDVVARFVMPMVNGVIKDGCELHGEFNYDWESNAHRDSSACAGPNDGNWFWSSLQTSPHQHEFENKLNVILFVTPYIPDSDERDRIQNFLTAIQWRCYAA
jgi:hypothetical protein